MNRVIEWCRVGITIEADQRHVREVLRGLELERANPAATPCAVENNSKGNARDDESEEENRRRRRRTQSKHEWDYVNESDSGHQPQMIDDDTSDSRALTGGDITRHRALVARIRSLSRPDLNQVRFDAIVLRNGQARTAGHGACQDGKAASEVLVPLAAEWRAGRVLRR